LGNFKEALPFAKKSYGEMMPARKLSMRKSKWVYVNFLDMICLNSQSSGLHREGASGKGGYPPDPRCRRGLRTAEEQSKKANAELA